MKNRATPLLQGRVIRSHGHQYCVLTGEQVLQCRPRGKFRLAGGRVLTGDVVEVQPTAAGEGYIVTVLPRRSLLTKPAVANADYVLLVYTAREPDLDLRMVDRLLVVVEASGLQPALCLNKLDLLSAREIEEATRIYRSIGYPVFATCAWSGEGVEQLSAHLQGKSVVLAGQSGVGKSRLLNALVPGADLRTGEVSAHLRRGRHTTRHVELLSLPGGGLVADSPGFTFLDLSQLKKEELAACFVEFGPPADACRFATCLHRREPGCGVKEAVREGAIAASRYEHYREFLEEIIARPPRY